MATKITAARIATGSGVRTVITHGQKPQQILEILMGADLGTQFEAQPRSDNARKRWIAYGLVPTGRIIIDGGAVQALREKGKSLLAIGVIGLEGEFAATDAVLICDRQGQELGRGLVNYNAAELAKIQGMHSEAIVKVLGYVGPDTVIHRDNLVLQD
jgi:glutamate 5-kinase